MCLTKGAPTKPRIGPCNESHGIPRWGPYSLNVHWTGAGADITSAATATNLPLAHVPSFTINYATQATTTYGIDGIDTYISIGAGTWIVDMPGYTGHYLQTAV